MKTDVEEQDLERMLAFANDIEDEMVRVRFLVDLVPLMNDELKALAVIRAIKDDLYRVVALNKLMPLLNKEFKIKALEIVQELEDKVSRASALADIAPYLSNELLAQTLQEALVTVREIENERNRASLLTQLAPFLNEELAILGLEIAREIKDDYHRANALTNLAPRLSDEFKALAHREALAAAREIKDASLRASALTNLAPHLSHEFKALAHREAYAAIGTIKDPWACVSALTALVPHLRDEFKARAIQEALAAARKIKNEYDRARALATLAPLWDGQFEMAGLEVAREINDASLRARTLTNLAPYLSDEFKAQALQEALAIAREIKYLGSRGVALLALIPYVKDKLNVDEIKLAEEVSARPLTVNEVKIPSIRSTEEVSFVAYHSKEGKVESWHTLLVYAHALSALKKVQQDAERFDDQIPSPKETSLQYVPMIAWGTEITITPSCDAITFNPERVSFKLMEDFHRADFRFKADQSLSGDAAKGQITISIGPFIIGTLKFAMLFNEKESQPAAVHEEHAGMYGKDDVFISYSRKDTEVARTFKTILEATGLDVFIDVDDIKSGQLWAKELFRRIESARIFQIFWSPSYSQSKYCRIEWEHALKQNKDEGYIRPVFWQKPLSPNPPEELNKFNFKYVELKVANGE